MGHRTLPETNYDRASEPRVPNGVGWSEFFHEFSLGTQGEGGSPSSGVERVQERALYASETGDRWSLVLNIETGRVLVRLQPNLASRGQSSDMEVGAFLVRGGMGPEKQELLRLIGSAVEMREVKT